MGAKIYVYGNRFKLHEEISLKVLFIGFFPYHATTSAIGPFVKKIGMMILLYTNQPQSWIQRMGHSIGVDLPIGKASLASTFIHSSSIKQ